jgi:hypothetical protein
MRIHRSIPLTNNPEPDANPDPSIFINYLQAAQQKTFLQLVFQQIPFLKLFLDDT